MPIKVVGIHHHAVRIGGDDVNLAANLDFYQGLLGLAPDSDRPKLLETPGFWINVGETGQIHLIGGEQLSPLSKGPGTHVALAMEVVADAKAELERTGTPLGSYWCRWPRGRATLHTRSQPQHGRVASS